MQAINNKDNAERQVSEDLPQMRSVMLMPTSPTSSLPPLPAPAAGKAFPPPLKQLRPLSLKNKPLSPVSQTPLQTDPWKVEHLKPLPEIYHLERTNVYVSGSSPRQIAQRIAACLHKESVVAKYDSEEACAKAETADNIRFRVRMYSDCGKVVVEVQRRSGCGYSFHQIAKAVLLAAKGESSSGLKRGPPKSFSVPESCKRRFQDTKEDEHKTIIESMRMASRMLTSKHLDAHQLAMESLFSLSASGTPEKKTFVAREMMRDDSIAILTQLIQTYRFKSDTDEIDQQHNSVMLRHALAILANCLSSLEKCGELCTVMKDKQAVFGDILLKKLHNLVEEHDGVSPHDSLQAAKCLQAITI